MSIKIVFLSAVRWSPLLAVLLVNALLITFIQEEYPRTVGYHQDRKQHPKLGVLRLEGPNIASIDMQVSQLPNRSVCVDYRTFNWTEQRQNPTQVPEGHRITGHRITKSKTLSAKNIQDVQKFVFFVGYPRSGHSIIASMMDAHPNMLIAHEYNLFRQWEKSPQKHSERALLYNALYRNSVESAENGWRSNRMVQKGYTLGVDHQWQASFTELKVIGDKSGATTAQLFDKNPAQFMEIVRELKQAVRIPLRVIHVVRNPYDIISTRLLYADGHNKKSKLPATEDRKHCNDYGISYHTNRTFHLVHTVWSLLKRTNLTVLDVHHADLIRNPRKTMSMICRFLNLPYPDDYLEACEKKAYSASPKTRLLVNWPKKIVEKVHLLARPYRFLWRYSFEGD